MHIGFWWKSQKERDHEKELDADGRILKWILKRQDEAVRTEFIWLKTGAPVVEGGSCEYDNEPLGSLKMLVIS
jgi:hypothetical protein